MKLTRFLLLILISFMSVFIFSWVACYAHENVVEAEGEAPVIRENKVQAKNKAKQNLYRDALEKAMGAYVEGITEMENFQVIKDKVFSQTKGIVTRTNILKEWVDDEKIYHIRANCTVSEKALDGVLGPVVIDTLGNPRIMVVVDEAIEGERPFLSTVEGEVLTSFKNAGYLIVDQDQVRSNHAREYEVAQQTGDVQKLKELAENFDADVVIYGKAQSLSYTKQKIEGQTLYGVRSQLQLKAIITHTGYVLGAEIPEVKKTGSSPQDGGVRGLRIASHKAADSLVNKVAYSLVSGSSGSIPGRTIKVYVCDISFSKVKKLKAYLESAESITGIYQRQYKDKRLEIDVNVDGTVDNVAELLESFGVDITGMTANAVEGDL